MKINVIILTYNHQNYIKQALESVISQETDYEIEILIADDASSDNTVSEIESVKKNTKVKIKTFYNQQNIGVLQNAMQVLRAVSAPYIAVLDGDDFWCNNQKLRTQIDFLESNTAYIGCFHDAEILSDLASKEILFANANKYSETYRYKENTYPADILKRLIIPTSSLVLRSTFLDTINYQILKDNYSLVWKLTCIAIHKSKLYYFNGVWSKYRNHVKGISKSNNHAFHHSHISFLHTIARDINYKNYLLDIYTSLGSEYQIILERTLKSDPGFKWLYFKYVKSELYRLYYFYKFLLSK